MKNIHGKGLFHAENVCFRSLSVLYSCEIVIFNNLRELREDLLWVVRNIILIVLLIEKTLIL